MIALQLAVFLGAFLLFLVQPLVAKQILPWFGGAPAVWSTCLVFFQVALVLGYGYAHLTSRLRMRTQALLHLGLLAANLALLPIAPSPALKPHDADDPAWRVLVLLVRTVGVPYVLLAATAPMLQDWYAKVRPSRVPYGLYALSNGGSLLALLCFPLVVEPALGIGAQARLWSIGFFLFIAVAGWSAWWALQQAPAVTGPTMNPPDRHPPPSTLDRFLVLSLSACGTGLLLAVTNQLCQEVAAVPLLWVIPLALYLVTFILSFAGVVSRPLWLAAFVVAALVSGYALVNAAAVGLPLQAAALLGLLFTACMVCHGELVRLKPAPTYLTGFYLTMSIGGSLGGLFVALAAPSLFDAYTELPLFVLMTAALAVAVALRDRAVRDSRPGPVWLWVTPLAAFLVSAATALDSGGRSATTVALARNFYGVLRVIDTPPGAALPRRGLFHGRVLHGAQFLEAGRRLELATDFAIGSGIERAFATHPRRVQGLPMTIGVVGLGAGAIAAFGRSGDSIRFYELNPQVIEFARTYFTFLDDSPAAIDVVAGDARISIELEMDRPGRRHAYDLLVVDAFAGAAIPVHLLTRESFSLYEQALAPDGVLAIHVSNQHLDLAPVVRGAAAERKWSTIIVAKRPDLAVGATASKWAIISRRQDWLLQLPPGDEVDEPRAPTRVWTDAFSSVTSVLSFAPQWYLVPPR